MKLKRLKKRASDENGFTLMEVLIAITILAVGMLAVASMQISGIQGNATANVLTGASAWAADRIEQLMTLPYNDPLLDPAAPASDTTVPEGRYTISWQVTENAPIDNVKTISVTVTWYDRGNKSLVYNYYKANI